MIDKVKLIILWISGLLGFGIACSQVGKAMHHNGDFPGLIAGALIFVCIRLWWTEAQSSK